VTPTQVFFLRVLRFPLSGSLPQCSIFTSIYMMLLPEGTTDEDWDHPKKQCSFRNS